MKDFLLSILSGIIGGLIANWSYEKHLRRFLNELEDKITKLPDELHRKALIKDLNEGNTLKVIENTEIKYSLNEFNKMRTGEIKGKLLNDIRNKITTGNPANESKIWKIRNWFKNYFC